MLFDDLVAGPAAGAARLGAGQHGADPVIVGVRVEPLAPGHPQLVTLALVAERVAARQLAAPVHRRQRLAAGDRGAALGLQAPGAHRQHLVEHSQHARHRCRLGQTAVEVAVLGQPRQGVAHVGHGVFQAPPGPQRIGDDGRKQRRRRRKPEIEQRQQAVADRHGQGQRGHHQGDAPARQHEGQQERRQQRQQQADEQGRHRVQPFDQLMTAQRIEDIGVDFHARHQLALAGHGGRQHVAEPRGGGADEHELVLHQLVGHPAFKQVHRRHLGVGAGAAGERNVAGVLAHIGETGESAFVPRRVEIRGDQALAFQQGLGNVRPPGLADARAHEHRAGHTVAVQLQVHMAQPLGGAGELGVGQHLDQLAAGAQLLHVHRQIDVSGGADRLRQRLVGLGTAAVRLRQNQIHQHRAGALLFQLVDNLRVNAPVPRPAAHLAEAVFIDADDQHVAGRLHGQPLHEVVVDVAVEERQATADREQYAEPGDHQKHGQVFHQVASLLGAEFRHEIL